MENPFRGMNPYLERHWRDVHASLVVYGRDALQSVLPGGLRARVEERVFVESEEGLERDTYPDLRVVERRRQSPAASLEQTRSSTAVPLVLRVQSEPISEGFIQIIEAGTSQRVITVVEFVSASNKRAGEGQDLYRQKQHECEAAGVSLVEIDLLRAGKRVLSVPDTRIPTAYRTPYRVCVRRGWEPENAELYRAPLRERLPVIRVPLRKSDADAPLALQELIDQCYRNAAYDDIDYSRDAHPPLDPEDAAWADGLLRETGIRK